MLIFNELSDLDHRLLSLIENIDPETEEIHQLVDKREQLIKTIVDVCKRNPNLQQSAQWQQVVESTRHIAQLMESKTEQLGQSLRKYRHGKRSLQQYKKFI
jgi:flagellar rod protein FlaI